MLKIGRLKPHFTLLKQVNDFKQPDLRIAKQWALNSAATCVLAAL
ncbi:hypothetical protein [Testudinibacter sp. TR-2022]|nr:hypothetical protein [Testudinibacter sp. TR-2022]